MRSRRIDPWPTPARGQVEVPGSKSITNRALAAAALATGTSTLRHVGRGVDTAAMTAAVADLGASVAQLGDDLVVTGVGGRPQPRTERVHAHQGGTVGRFLVPMAALASAPVVVDADPQLRARPFAPLLDAVTALGATVTPLEAPAHLPVQIDGGTFVDGGTVPLRGDVSSQFLSALLLAGPATRHGITVELTTELVSRPYVDMTAAVMAAFGASVDIDGNRLVTSHDGYRSADHVIEPDASAATYPLAAAVVTGGAVQVVRLVRPSLQGDLGFIDDLEAMGATVSLHPGGCEVAAGHTLVAIDVDLAHRSDTVPTLAAVAAFAAGTTRIRGVGFIRNKESDRIAATVDLLRSCGIEAHATDDGLDVVGTGGVRPSPVGVVTTHDDHRLAMAAAVVASAAAGPVTVDDADCVSKSFPDFWDVWDELAARSARA